ncbi:AAA family ATPase [Amycolatopsis sp. CA-126428]|uniref:AAA family ATPase n=1 Tax=Amycolatopsis sp. CA-126428 TaxID=2073158 RepID=UPI000CD143F6|nr:ATP-binding protein [Amycolatopsis sp. CA-126428]
MLRSFRLGNHRSFRDEQELLLMPARPGDARRAVPVAAIYGANASGKSNLLNGLWYMQTAVLETVGGIGGSEGFRLDDGDEERSSSYVVELVAEGNRYTYGFVVRGEIVEQEWLYSYPEKRRRVLLERTGEHIKFGSTVPDLKAKLTVLDGLIQPDALVLGICKRLSLEPLMPVYEWFKAGMRIHYRHAENATDPLGQRVAAFLRRSPDHSRRLLGLLVAADVGITDISIENIGEPIRQPHASMTLQQVRRPGPGQARLKFRHGASGVPFDLVDESAGTLNWLDLLPEVLDVLDAGRLFVVDEIDGSLHPRLTAKLIELFQSTETNPHSAQLIFTTHDTSLLGTMLGGDLLDRDQVWFVEKGADGASELYPLTDFKPRKDQNTERRYLAGSYGAVPVLGDFAEAVAER